MVKKNNIHINDPETVMAYIFGYMLGLISAALLSIFFPACPSLTQQRCSGHEKVFEEPFQRQDMVPQKEYWIKKEPFMYDL